MSGNQTIVLSLRTYFCCSLTHNDSGRFDWWCRLRQILAGVRVYLCCNQSAPDRFWVLWRPFHVVQPLPVDNFQILGSDFLQVDGFRHLQLLDVRKLSVDLLCVKQVSTLGSVVFLVPVDDPLSPLSLIVGHRRQTTNLCAAVLTSTSVSCRIGIPPINL